MTVSRTPVSESFVSISKFAVSNHLRRQMLIIVETIHTRARKTVSQVIETLRSRGFSQDQIENRLVNGLIQKICERSLYPREKPSS